MNKLLASRVGRHALRVLLGLALLCLACPNAPPEAQPKDAVELVPADNEITGWTRSSALQICENSTQLFALIDGEGQPYVDNGFTKCAFQTYSGTISSAPVELKLRIFDMGDSVNARKIYVAVAAGSETPWTGNNAGLEARIDASMQFAYRVDFRDNEFYVSNEVSDKSDAALDVAKLFALNVSGAIHDTTH
jgi:hypothetical protein